MKTIKHILIASFFTFALVSAGFAGSNKSNDKKSKPPPSQPEITYQVNVIMSSEQELCNTYLIVITDQDGSIMTYPQDYIMGVQTYSFNEQGPIEGDRFARLIRNPGEQSVCDTHLWATPDMEQGPFMNGGTYHFVLKPSTKQQPH